jgi:hypothetical protein
MLSDFELDVRHYVYRHFVEQGHAPDAYKIAEHLKAPLERVLSAFYNLAAARALVLRPSDSTKILLALPFSSIPTTFWVETPSGSWWGNCIWDSLAIAAMLKEPTKISTTFGASGKPVTVTVDGDKISPDSTIVHIAVPAKHWWDDVCYTCSTILLFESEADIDPWCKRHNIPRGGTMSMQQAWELAKAWYSNRLDREWQRRPIEEAVAILDRLGLTGKFWDLHPDQTPISIVALKPQDN